MLVFEFIGTKNNDGSGWIDFMINEVIRKNHLNQILENRIHVIETESIQYELEYDSKIKKERRACRPLVKIYTTMPGALVDELRSLLKSGLSAQKSVEQTLFLNQKINSNKKRKELLVLAKIFKMKPDGFSYLVIKC